MHAIAVELPWDHIAQITVPDVLGPFRQRDALEFAPALAVEQAKSTLRRICGEQREIRSAAVPGRPQRRGAPAESRALEFRNEKNCSNGGMTRLTSGTRPGPTS